HVLAPWPAYLPARGEAERELHDPVVQERAAKLDRPGHRVAIVHSQIERQGLFVGRAEQGAVERAWRGFILRLRGSLFQLGGIPGVRLQAPKASRGAQSTVRGKSPELRAKFAKGLANQWTARRLVRTRERVDLGPRGRQAPAARELVPVLREEWPISGETFI